ncbi:DUF2637 domain-containing protein [Streptomyces capparidis]
MRVKLTRVDAVLVQAVIAGALSFAHLHEIAEAAGQDGWKAWAYPISVDLLLVAAWRRLRTGAAKVAGWFWFLIALAASLGANVATAGLLDLNNPPGWLRILVAGWPAVAFFGGTLLAHTRPAPAADHDRDDTAVTVEQVTPAPPAVGLAPELPPTPTPEPTPEPEPVPAVEPPPAAPPVPAALLDHARKLADSHQTTTGTPITADTLRARLGVPPQLAHAIHAQLT